ncbi:hypothetical protein L596_021021 [Steinernema carpocapsae]|uniref:Uncharacterized protein n=1 Tax=Steinernema carpocapsae TaxID=34508 RepID=A0A4V6A136_STECR|nr:hypothetical protein L596_021021 [Steinernema carpocapsae]
MVSVSCLLVVLLGSFLTLANCQLFYWGAALGHQDFATKNRDQLEDVGNNVELIKQERMRIGPGPQIRKMLRLHMPF